jgi:hypothetical protein
MVKLPRRFEVSLWLKDNSKRLIASKREEAGQIGSTSPDRKVMASCGYNYHDNRPWGQKSRSALASTPNVNRGKKREKKLVVLLKLGCLATYIGY